MDGAVQMRLESWNTDINAGRKPSAPGAIEALNVELMMIQIGPWNFRPNRNHETAERVVWVRLMELF